MNEQEMKELVGTICPELNLEGCYSKIMPRVTSQQLAQLLGVAERGENAEMWSWVVVQFLKCGQKEVVAAEIERLVRLVNGSYDAALVLHFSPDLTPAHRTALVKRVTRSSDAAWVLWNVPKLTDGHQDALVKRVTDKGDAAWVLLVYAPSLSDKHRTALAKVAGYAGD